MRECRDLEWKAVKTRYTVGIRRKGEGEQSGGNEMVRCVLVEAGKGQKAMECWGGSEMKAGGTWVCVYGCRRYRGMQGSGVRGVCQYRCSVIGRHSSGQEAESTD